MFSSQKRVNILCVKELYQSANLKCVCVEYMCNKDMYCYFLVDADSVFKKG